MTKAAVVSYAASPSESVGLKLPPLWLRTIAAPSGSTVSSISSSPRLKAASTWPITCVHLNVASTRHERYAIRLLGTHEVLRPGTAQRIAQAVGFRNVLVHQYAEVDDRIVTKALSDLGDLRAFVSEVSAWILGQAQQRK